jgi:endoglucanase
MMTVAGVLLSAPIAHSVESTPTRETQAGEARFGVNIAVAEFAGHIIPGVYGVQYTYPSADELEYYRSKGRTLIRLPFLWERMQHSLNAPLDTAELGYLKEFLRIAREKKLDVILDVHNYGRYKFAGVEGEAQIIGSERVPYSAFADFWSRLATAVKDESAVYGYGLMNEPHDMEGESRWPQAAQAAIDAIRKVDKKTTIMVSGDDFSGTRFWRTSRNEKLNENVRDPQNNLVFEAHCYFDKNLSGSYAKSYDEEGASPNVGIEHVRPFVEWCKEKGVRGYIGEFGAPNTDARWLVTMDRFCAYLKENKISSTYWAGGPWWDKYPLSIEPTDARADPNVGAPDPVDRPQMLILRQYPG